MISLIKQIILAVILCGISLATFANKLDINKAVMLKPDVERGKQIYQKNCARCHHESGWPYQSYISKQRQPGTIPLIAGQHINVLIKQLIDIRNGDRENPIMYRYTQADYITDESDIVNVSAYISQLPKSDKNRQGDASQLSLGKRLYNNNCKTCHGVSAEGNNQKFIPSLQGQDYNYLLHQFVLIRFQRRDNTHPEMVQILNKMSRLEKTAVLDFISHIKP